MRGERRGENGSGRSLVEKSIKSLYLSQMLWEVFVNECTYAD